MADLSAADVGALIGSRTSMGGGAGAWGLGAGLLGGLFFGSLINGGGWFGGNRGNQYATQEQVQGMFNYSNLLDQNRDLATAISNGTAQAIAATNQTFHDTTNILQDKYSEITRDIAAVQVAQAQALANQNQCCCDTKLLLTEQNAGTNANIAQSRYDAAMNTAAINANTTAQTQKILDAITGNRMADMQNQINQLALANQMLGVVKYPMSTAYTSGNNPFCNCGGCGCGF